MKSLEIINEIKDIDARMRLIKAIAVSGDGFDMAIVPKGTFFNKPEKIGNHEIFESELVEVGRIIFANSNKLGNYF